VQPNFGRLWQPTLIKAQRSLSRAFKVCLQRSRRRR
jgi:hypothetical protein